MYNVSTLYLNRSVKITTVLNWKEGYYNSWYFEEDLFNLDDCKYFAR